jgi:hexosaminidase
VPVTISDYPRYSHRGLLIDSSRHFLPVSSILSLVDSLSLSKINVLHWHIVDAESFPFDSQSEPDMVKGAYTSDLVYSAGDIKRVTAFAAERGVRVIFEVDVPGHAGMCYLKIYNVYM